MSGRQNVTPQSPLNTAISYVGEIARNFSTAKLLYVGNGGRSSSILWNPAISSFLLETHGVMVKFIMSWYGDAALYTLARVGVDESDRRLLNSSAESGESQSG